MQHFILKQFARETREMTRKKEKYLVITLVTDYVTFCIESYKWTKKRYLLYLPP